MKRILALTLCLIMVACSLTSWAASGIEAEIKYDPLNESFTVSGTITNEKSNIVLALEVKENGDILAASQTVANELNADGDIVFSFEPFMLNSGVATGNLDFIVSALYMNSTWVGTYSYVGVDANLADLKSVKEYIDNEDKDGLIEYIKNNSETLNIDKTFLENEKMTDNAKDKWWKNISELELNLPEGYTEKEQQEQIKKAMLDMRQTYNDAVSVGEFLLCDSTQKVKEWFEKYYDYYGLGIENEKTSYSEAEIGKLYDRVKTKEQFLSRFVSLDKTDLYINEKTGSEIDTIDEIRAYIYECVLLTEINVEQFQYTKKVLTEFSELFSIKSGFDKLSKDEQSEIYAEISGNKYDTYGQASKAVNDLIPSGGGNPSGGNGSNNSNNSGSIFGNGGNNGASIGVGFPVADANAEEIVFNDIDSVPWAKEAILYLYNEGIVNGKEDKKFDPNGLITRAEFIKMLVLTTKKVIEDEYTMEFPDVKNTSWYYKYICAAKNAGLVQGDDKGCMNPESNILREEMTTMMFRAYNINQDLDLPELTFADKNEISEYAIQSVEYFVSRGIVNGVGDNRFAPKVNATRAETAKIIYHVINNIR